MNWIKIIARQSFRYNLLRVVQFRVCVNAAHIAQRTTWI